MTRVRILSLTTMLTAVPWAALAQEARVTGSVADPSGAMLVGARVTLTQTQRNVKFQTVSDNDGRLLLPRLPIGTYDVRAEKEGFKTYLQSGVDLTTNADVLLNIRMELGNVTESVSVTAEASRVNTESATMQQLVDSARIIDLPLNGRNVYQLARLVPGVGESGTNIGGGRSGSQNSTMVNIRVDGTLNVDNAFAFVLPSPSPDAVQEFSIQTSVPPAKYGFAAGVIEISTKSGTNAFHGSLYEFLRNDKLDARSFFLAQKLKRKRNQYGFAGGGPVWIPKLYNGRDKTFWFVNVEQQKEPLGAQTTILVPTTRQRIGDFGDQTRVIRDPLNNQPFANNLIPSARVDPLAVNYLRGYVPDAQDALGTHRYIRPNDNNPSQILGRGDQILAGGQHQINGRVFITRRTGPRASGNLPAFAQGLLEDDTDLLGLNHTWTVAPNKINTLRVGFNGWYNNSKTLPEVTLEELKRLGFASNYYTYTPDWPVINVSGYFTGSVEQIIVGRDYGTYSWSDDFSWIRGKHHIQIGHDGLRTIQNTLNLSRTQGAYTYNGSFSGLGLSDFMLGRPSLFRQGSPAPDGLRGLHLSWYVQDDIRVSRRLTVNLGLRYELPFAPRPTNDASIIYRPGRKSEIFKNAPTGLLFPGDSDVPDRGRPTVKTLFAPRVGFSLSLSGDQKTVVRGGYGVYYNPSWTNIEGQFAIVQPFSRILDLVAPASTSNPWANFAGGNPHPYQPNLNSPFDPEINSMAYGPNFREPTTQQWNLNLQRELWRNTLITAGYVGSRGRHLPHFRDINSPAYTAGQSTVANTNQRRPMYPNFARFSLIESVINTSYDAFQASVDRRMSRGITVLFSYTFSKTLTDLNSVLTQNVGASQDPFNRRPEWAPADHDRTQALVTSWVWQVPSGSWNRGFTGAVFDNWEVNGIVSRYSGAPLAFGLTQDRSLRAHPNRADRLRDARMSYDRPRAVLIENYFDKTAYVVNRTGEFGSAPRSEAQLRGPGTLGTTLGINKAFRGFGESHRLQFRTELFNAINRPDFGNPGTNLDTPATFGRITTAGDGRIIQFALKYLF